MATGTQKILGHLAMLLFALLIAGSFSLGHLAAPHIDAAALNAVRFTLATCLLGVVFVLINRKIPPLPKQVWRYGILGGLMAAYFILMFVALKISTPVSVGAVFTFIPLLATIFGWFILKQTTKPIVLLASITASVGAIWVIFRGDIQAILAFEIGPGEAIFFIGCAAHALYAPLIKKFNKGEPVVYFTLFTLASTSIWIILVGLGDLISMDWLALPNIVWIAIAYLAIFTTAGTFFLLQFASMRLPASKVLSYGYLTPTFIILIEGMIGHGWVSASVFAGALLTACALLVMAFAPDS